MNWSTAERVAWTLAIGGFLAVLVGALLSPDPTAFWPYAAGSLAVGVPVAHWYVGRQLGEFPTRRAGRLTIFFLALFGVSYIGFWLVERVAVPDTTVDLAGRAVTVLVALSVARRVTNRDGERYRDGE